MPNKKASISHTNESELTHSMAHYLLTIHKLREEKGYARVTDIAKELGTVGYLDKLKRLRVGNYTKENCLSMDDLINGNIDK